MHTRKFITLIVLAIAPVALAQTLSPTPIIVQAAKPAVTTTTAATSTVSGAASSLPTSIKALQEMKSANDELLIKQRAALEKLDEVEKAAQQLKIYSKRT